MKSLNDQTYDSLLILSLSSSTRNTLQSPYLASPDIDIKRNYNGCFSRILISESSYVLFVICLYSELIH